MYEVIVTIILIVAVLLILVVLAQNPKGGGLSSQFGGSGSTQLMGVKKTNDLLEKLTWGLAVALLVFSVATNFVGTQQVEGLSSPNIDNAQQNSTFPPVAEPTEGGLEDLNLGETPADTDSSAN